MRKSWQTSKVETWEISIDEITYAKGEYPNCTHVHAMGRKVKKIVITCIQGLNGSITPNSFFKLCLIPGSSILKSFNFVAIYASKFFPVNIEECSLLGLPYVLADSAIPF